MGVDAGPMAADATFIRGSSKSLYSAIPAYNASLTCGLAGGKFYMFDDLGMKLSLRN